MLRVRSVLLFLALTLSLSWPVTAQMVHRGVFFTDITSQLPPEVLSRGRVVEASSNGQEIILLAQTGDIAAFYRQATGGRFVSLIADNDPRIKGKFIYRPLSSRPDLIYSTTYEHSLYGLGFNAFKDDSPRQSSAYFIKKGDATPELIAVAGETVTASNQFETAFPITINYAGAPSVSINGKRKFLFLYAFQQPNNRQRSGIYAAEDGKYKQLLRSDYPTPFTISDDFGIREDKKSQLWFVEIQYNSATQSSDWYLSVFDPATGEKINVYKTGNPILGERSDYISYIRDNVSQELYAATGFYDPRQQKGQIRVVSLNLSSFPGEIFRPLFNVPSQFQDGTSIYVSNLVGISNNVAVVRFWKDYQGNEIVAGLWNGENVSVLLNENDRLPDGKQIGKLSYKIGPHTYHPGTFAGCEGTIFTFNPDGTVQYWLKFFTPCIQQAPASAKSGEEIVLKGQNLSVTASLADVAATDDLGKETVITPTRVSPTEVAFLAPLVTEAKVFKIKVRQNQSGGPVESNAVSIRVEPPLTPPPVITALTSIFINALSSLKTTFAPYEVVTLWGKGMCESAAAAQQISQLPTELAGCKVVVDNVPARLYYISPTQTNLQLPALSPGGHQLTVQSRQVVSGSFQFRVETVSPSFVTNPQNSVYLQKADGSFVTGENPARAGERLVVYGTGLGLTTPDVPYGNAGVVASVISPVKIIINGEESEVAYAGTTWEFPGLYQINFTVPADALPDELGLAWLEIKVGNTSAVFRFNLVP